MGRRGYSSISVSVDLDDVLNDIATEDLVEELKARRSEPGEVALGITSDWVDRLRFYLDRGDIHGARAMLVSEEVQALVGSEAREAQYRSMMQ